MNKRFKVLKSAVGSGQMAVAVSAAGTVIEFVEAIDPEEYPAGAGKPEDTLLGLLNLRLRLPNKGDTETLTVYLSEPSPEGYQWFKYDAIRAGSGARDRAGAASRTNCTSTHSGSGGALKPTGIWKSAAWTATDARMPCQCRTFIDPKKKKPRHPVTFRCVRWIRAIVAWVYR